MDAVHARITIVSIACVEMCAEVIVNKLRRRLIMGWGHGGSAARHSLSQLWWWLSRPVGRQHQTLALS
jgi:hypothetical protein